MKMNGRSRNGSERWARLLVLMGASLLILLSTVIRAEPQSSPLERRTYHAVMDGDLLYLASTRGLVVRRVAESGKTDRLSALELPGTPLYLNVQASWILVSSGPEGIFLVNIEEPASPTLEGRLRPGSPVMGAVQMGTTAFLAAGHQGVCSVGLSATESLSLMECLPTKRHARAVAVWDKWLFVADDGGFGAFVTDEARSLRELSWIDMPGPAHDLSIQAGLGIVACGAAGAILVDLSVPGMPQPLAVIPSQDSTRGVALSGDIAVIADSTAGLVVVDVSDPLHPRERARILTRTPALRVSLSGESGTLLLASVDSGGFLIYDIDNPDQPVKRGGLF